VLCSSTTCNVPNGRRLIAAINMSSS
jgi:hypothetical protein